MTESAMKHDIIIKSRSGADINGVKNVISFDEESICLDTSMGELVIDGEELNVSTLDTENGIIRLSGRINSVYYTNTEPVNKKGFFGRLMG